MIPLAAERVFSIGSFAVTNTYINAVTVMVFFLAVGIWAKTSLREQPGRVQSAIEIMIEGLLGIFDQVTGNRKRTLYFFPVVGTMFFFILLSNWMGLIPGLGSLGIWEVVHGERELVPIFRSAASDYNLTLVMTLIAVFGSHILGFGKLGPFVHLSRFFPLGTLFRALISLKPTRIITGVVGMFVGIVELFGEFAKIVSLSFRLFGNIFAGEILLSVMYSFLLVGLPIPFLGMEFIFGLVQALVFPTLTLVYLHLMSSAPHELDPESNPAHAVHA